MRVNPVRCADGSSRSPVTLGTASFSVTITTLSAVKCTFRSIWAWQKIWSSTVAPEALEIGEVLLEHRLAVDEHLDDALSRIGQPELEGDGPPAYVRDRDRRPTRSSAPFTSTR